METQVQDTPIVARTKELCEALLQQPEVASIRERIDAFMAREDLRSAYDVLMMKGDMVRQKQQVGLQPTEDEVTDLENEFQQLMANPEVQNFEQARKEMYKIQDQVAQYVAKTFEMGRVPEDYEIDYSCGDCGCGEGGCGS